MSPSAPAVRGATGLVLALAALALAGCGSSGSAGGERPNLRVSAAASLKQALESSGSGAAYSFAGSDALAAQIRRGARPDVFAAANTKLPDALFAEGLVERPVRFATNELVVAVPATPGRVRAFDDLGDDGVTLAVGAEAVPVGSYTATVLGRLPAARRRAIEGNVRTREPDVGGVVGKLTQGAVDAGFVYASDVRGAGGRLRAIAIPEALEPRVAYGAAVVKGAPEPGAAAAYVRDLRSGAGQRALRRAGFGPPPG